MKTALTTIFLLLALQTGASNLNELTANERSLKIYFRNADFSPETFKLYLQFIGVSNTEIVFKQAKLETAHFKSNVFKRCNNLFGMKVSRIRKNTTSGFILADFGKVAKYSHWTDSVNDYLLWQSIQMPKFYTGNYYEFLELAGYATNKNYNNILKNIK
jgi:uncharacterized FlgJ-related protein